jgi:hypothetical protein
MVKDIEKEVLLKEEILQKANIEDLPQPEPAKNDEPEIKEE